MVSLVLLRLIIPSPPDPPPHLHLALTPPVRAQIPRKLLHSSIALVVLYLWLSHPNLLTLLRYLAYATTVIATADVLRFRFAWFERAYEGLLGYFMVRRDFDVAREAGRELTLLSVFSAARVGAACVHYRSPN